MEWQPVKTINGKSNLPKHTNNVLVSDGYGACAVAWCERARFWHVSTDLISAENYDGGCHISIHANEIKFWTEIDTESCPLPNWED